MVQLCRQLLLYRQEKALASSACDETEMRRCTLPAHVAQLRIVATRAPSPLLLPRGDFCCLPADGVHIVQVILTSFRFVPRHGQDLIVRARRPRQLSTTSAAAPAHSSHTSAAAHHTTLDTLATQTAGEPHDGGAKLEYGGGGPRPDRDLFATQVLRVPVLHFIFEYTTKYLESVRKNR